MSIGLFLAANAVSLVLAISGAVLCWKQREGWGWFLVGSIFTFASSATISALPAAS